jgi:uncharacterized protein with HEPN domain
MRKDDLIRIRHMVDSGREALAFVSGRERGELDRSRMLTLSLLKSIEIIGEAASKVTVETRNLHKQIPWEAIVAMRNRLICLF